MGMLISVLGGMLAGAIFRKVWKMVAREDDAPKATDAQRGWPEILLAAALQGAIFAPSPQQLAGRRPVRS
jgi:hypothetical protein